MADNENDQVTRFLAHGSELAGAAVGGAIGFVVGGVAAGPAGAAGASAIGALAGKLVQEMATRLLSGREKVRVGATAAYAISEIRERIERGQQPRDDGFFEAEEGKPSPAEEVFEGVLVAAKNDHEELKAQYYAKLFANVAFAPDCSREEANYLLKVMDRLTYLQLVLLRIFSEPGGYRLRSTSYRPGERITYELIAVLWGAFDLFRSEMLRLLEPTKRHGTIVLEMKDIQPAHVHLSLTGARLAGMAGLGEIAGPELDRVVALLSAPPIPPDGTPAPASVVPRSGAIDGMVADD